MLLQVLLHELRDSPTKVANAVEVILAAPKKVPEGTKDRCAE